MVTGYELAYRESGKRKRVNLRYSESHRENIRNNTRKYLKTLAGKLSKVRNLARRKGTFFNGDGILMYLALTELCTKDMAEQPLCYICGEPIQYWEAAVDHLIPTSRGGYTVQSNLILAHHACNSHLKAHRLAHEVFNLPDDYYERIAQIMH